MVRALAGGRNNHEGHGVSTTTTGALIGAAIDSISGDDDSVADGAIIGAVTANVLKVVLPLAVTYAVAGRCCVAPSS